VAILVSQGMASTLTSQGAPSSPARGWWRKAAWWLAMVSCLLLWLFLGHDPERWPDLSLLQYLPFALMAPPALLLALFMWPLGGRWRWVAWAPLALVLGPIMGLCTGLPDQGSVRVRMMTYNAKAFLALNEPGGASRLATEVWRADADILVMQDVGNLPQWQALQPEPYKLMFGERHVEAFGQYVIASRTPLRDCAASYIPFEGHQHTFFHCMTEVKGQAVEVLTVHFNTPRDGLNATRFEGLKGLAAWRSNLRERLHQSAYLSAYVRQTGHPCILAGDLNAPERSRVVQNLLHEGLRDAFSSSAWGWGYTHGHSLLKGHAQSFIRIDHILVSTSIGVRQAWVGGKGGSQHRPVIADLVLVRD
jgi:endonuclease/exonuclease/phosphatase family metal-dependent hydrolase